MDKPHSGFKVTLQKPAKIKTFLDAHVIGQEGAKNPLRWRYITIINVSFTNPIILMWNWIKAIFY